MAQERITRGGGAGEDDTQGAAGGQEQILRHTAETDDLLDEIDGILETNAEEFVKTYVQKGGE